MKDKSERLFEYRPADEILVVRVFANTHFDDLKKIDRAFALVDSYWRRHVKKKVFCIIDWNGLQIHPSVQSHFFKHRDQAVNTYGPTVRFGADLVARTVLRAAAVKTHVPSNVYATLEEAIEVVCLIRRGSIEMQ
jgi:hypothetical protein